MRHSMKEAEKGGGGEGGNGVEDGGRGDGGRGVGRRGDGRRGVVWSIADEAERTWSFNK